MTYVEFFYIFLLVIVGWLCYYAGKIEEGWGSDTDLSVMLEETKGDPGEVNAVLGYECYEIEGMCEGCGKVPPSFLLSPKEPVRLGGQVIAPAYNVELCLQCSKNLIQRQYGQVAK